MYASFQKNIWILRMSEIIKRYKQMVITSKLIYLKIRRMFKQKLNNELMQLRIDWENLFFCDKNSVMYKCTIENWRISLVI